MRAHYTRVLGALLCLFLVSSMLTGAALAGVAAASEHGENSTEAPPGDTAPGSADTARVTPLRFSEEWLHVEVAQQDSAFNTTGPFAMFSITEPVEAVRISEQSADAELLDGQQTVIVRYEEDAAPRPDKPALYSLEVFYADGSEAQIELWASGTDVSVEAAELQDYKAFVYDVRGDARSAGYEENPEGVTAYYEDTQERAELLDNLFVEKAAQAVATVMSWLMNPIGLAITLLLVAVGSYYRLSRRGYTLDVISNDSGKAQRLRERLRLTYKQHQQTADEERLSEIAQIGDSSEVYWRDAEGVSTVYQLAELARSGKTIQRDGELQQAHAGVADLEAGMLEKSWLEAVAGPGRGRIASYDIALSHMKTACERMMSTYGMGHIYRDTYEELVQLIDERQEIVREGGVAGSARSSGGDGAAAAGGD